MKNTNKYDSADQSHVFTSFPVAHNDQEDMQNLLDNTDDQQSLGTADKEVFLEEKSYSFWQIEFYQKYFNVNTNEVLTRILGSMTPTFNSGFLYNKIRPNPDLYGPFWVSITLIFTVAIAGNVVSFFRNFGNSQYVWQTDFHKVSSSAACIITYWWLLPTILYIMMRWRENQADYKFLEILCIYGYSLSIYIPLSLLWLINISFLQWILTSVAVLLSGSVLILNIWPAFKHETNKKITFSIMALILIFHALLGIGFMVYFFHYPNESNVGQVTTNEYMTSKINNSSGIGKISKRVLVEEVLTITKSMITQQASKADLITAELESTSTNLS